MVWLALLAPVITPYNPDHAGPQQHAGRLHVAHWLGTDQFGRDVLTRMLWGPGSTCASASWPCSSRSSSARPGLPCRLLRRLGGHRRHAPGGHLLRVPVLRDGHRPGLRPGAGRDEHLPGDPAGRGCRTPRSSAARSWSPSSRTTSWRPGSRGFSHVRVLARHTAPNVLSQAIMLRDERHRAGHHGHRHPRLPGAGHPPPTAEWGIDDRRRPAVHDHPLGAVDDPRPRGRDHRPRAVVARRRPVDCSPGWRKE